VTIFAWLHTLLVMAVVTGGTGFHPPWHRHHTRHDHPAKVVVAAHEDGHGAFQVSTRNGVSHVKLGHGRHGLEVWSDDSGRSRVTLGDALKVESDDRGGSTVRLGDLVVDSDGSD
jgi:hypothetical protein